MDFMVSVPRTRKLHDSSWVIVGRMTKSAHLIPVKSTYIAKDYEKLYIDEIVRWHGIPLSIISYRVVQFTSHFWRSFQKSLGTQEKHSTAFYPQTDGQAKGTIRTFKTCCEHALLTLSRVGIITYH